MEKIEVGYRNIGSVGSIEYYHKFLIYTDSNGNQYTTSGWTGMDVSSTLPNGYLNIITNLPYDKYNPDHPDYSEKNQLQQQYRESITEGEDLSNLWNDMANNAKTKDDIYPYDPFLQNSNTFADSVLKDMNLSEPVDDNIYDFSDHWAPASDKELDKNITPINPQENTGLKYGSGVKC